MISKFLDFDPFSGVTQTFHYDPVTDETHIESHYPDLQANMNACAEERNTVSTHDGIKEEWWHVGHIPMALIHKLWIERGVNLLDKNNSGAALRLLHDEFSKFKTTDGTHLPKVAHRQIFLPRKPDAA